MWYDGWIAWGLIPDAILRMGIRSNLRQQLAKDTKGDARVLYTTQLYERLTSSPIALTPDVANEQHYEVPTSFFTTVLGPRLKYSSCYWETDQIDLMQAEEDMLALTCQRADINDGMKILDLGCGWGSFALYAAEMYPNSHITAVSNSKTQKQFIDSQASERNLSNIEAIRSDINDLQIDSTFDVIVSIEMFEHARNYPALFEKVASMLLPTGRLFIHIFARKGPAYLFESGWMTRYFFTGGTMPNVDTIIDLNPSFELENKWEINGHHYQRTLETWLANMDSNKAVIKELFKSTYGSDARRFFHYWRTFFMACSELFGYDDGEEWVVMHYLFKPHR